MMLEKLETSQRQAQRAQGEADKLAHQLREVEREAQKKLQQAEEALKDARKRAGDALESTLREIRLEAAEIFDSIKSDRSTKGAESAREKLRDLQEVGQEIAKDWKPGTADRPRSKVTPVWEKGMSVRVEGYSQVGILVEEPRGGKAQVQLGPLRMTVKEQSLTAVEKQKAPLKAKPNTQLSRAMNSSPEINLRHMRAEEAERDLEKFLDESMLAGLPSVRIVHGKGGGVLRAMTHRILKSHQGISRFQIADASEGGDGATIAYLD